VVLNSFQQKAYLIRDWAKEYLKEHPELLK